MSADQYPWIHLLCLSVCLSVCLFVSLSSCMSTCLSFCLLVRSSIYLSVSLSLCQSTDLHICLPVCMYVCFTVYLPACLSTFLHVCLSTCFHVCIFSVYISHCLSICLAVCPTVSQIAYLIISMYINLSYYHTPHISVTPYLWHAQRRPVTKLFTVISQCSFKHTIVWSCSKKLQVQLCNNKNLSPGSRINVFHRFNPA